MFNGLYSTRANERMKRMLNTHPPLYTLVVCACTQSASGYVYLHTKRRETQHTGTQEGLCERNVGNNFFEAYISHGLEPPVFFLLSPYSCSRTHPISFLHSLLLALANGLLLYAIQRACIP
jgi:hypothetical protein